MRLTRDLQVVDGVQRAAVMMGTPSNRALLRDAGLLTPDGDAASPNDLIIAVEAADMAAAHAGAQAAETALSTSRVFDTDKSDDLSSAHAAVGPHNA